MFIFVFFLFWKTDFNAQEIYQKTADRADSLRRAGNYSSSIPLYQSVLDEISNSDSVALNKYQIRIGLSYGMLGKNELARKNYLEVLQRTANDTLNIFRAHAYNNLGLLCDNEGTFVKSIQYYRKALALYDWFKDDFTKDVVRMNIGIVQKKTGKYKAALANIIESVHGFESRNNYRQLGECYSLLGSIQNLMGDISKAKKYHRKSIEIRKKSKDNYGLASAYNNLGNMYLKLQQLDSAAFFFNQAIVLTENTSSKNLGSNYHNLGIIRTKQEKYQEARKYFEKALKTQNQIADSAGIIETQNELALLEILHGKPEKGFDLLQKNKELLQVTPNNKLLKDQYDSYKEYYKKVGLVDSALFYLELTEDLRKKINQEEYIKEIAQLQETYEAKAREKEIGHLSHENLDKKARLKKAQEAIEKRNKIIGIFLILLALLGVLMYVKNLHASKMQLSSKLEGMEEEKNRLAKELHDFSGAKLRSLKIDLQNFINEDPDNTPLKKIHAKLDEITYSIVDISHELKTPRWKNCKFSLFISDVLYDWQENKKFSVTEKIHDSNLVDAIPDSCKIHVYRFILESLTNIQRHSNATNIVFKTSVSNNYLNFEILDNGNLQRNYKKGIGHYNMTERAAEINGKFKFTLNDAGGHAIFSIPLTKKTK